MIRADHLHLKGHVLHLFKHLEDMVRIEEQDIGEVFLGVNHDLIPHLIVKSLRAGIMLSKAITGKEDLVFIGIGKHAIGPVNHPCLHKSEGPLPQTQFPAILHGLVIPFRVIMLREILVAHLGAIDGFIFSDPVHHSGKPPRVVHFRVVTDHVVNLLGIYDLTDVMNQFVGKLLFYRIYQSNFLIQDEKGIVGRSLFG